MILKSEQDENGVVVQTHNQLIEQLAKLHKRNNSFFILEDCRGNYVQCAGSKKALILEYRQVMDETSFRHFVLGKGSKALEIKEIAYSGETAPVVANERLSIADAEVCFLHFFSWQTVDEATFQLREITDAYLSGECMFVLFVQIQSYSISAENKRKIRRTTATSFENLLIEEWESYYECAHWFASD